MTGPVVKSEPGSFVHFQDPDGNDIYFWEVVPDRVKKGELEKTSV